MENDLLSTVQAGKIIGITERGVVSAIQRKRLIAQRIGGRWVIYRKDAEKYRTESQHKGYSKRGRPSTKHAECSKITETNQNSKFDSKGQN